MVKYDLTHYQCPQFFVQFKYQLKLALINKEQEKGLDTITFLILSNSDIKDIERYLIFHKFKYQIQNCDSNNELIINLVRGNI
ncbi:hypothetical protein CJF42_04000 [Pseudoalteromonas sp. NBT06-2]|nr:hypothetical protein CJF42_04000 [Pseudoalteromonas sp. NBT06-2]